MDKIPNDTTEDKVRFTNLKRGPRWPIGFAGLASNHRLSPCWVQLLLGQMLRTCPSMALVIEQDIKCQLGKVTYCKHNTIICEVPLQWVPSPLKPSMQVQV